ncbi:MAG: glycosyltransferase [archaeon]
MKFYSIVVPARNEEKYLARTINHLKSLDYPKDKYEVIIVESGSTDKTLSVAKKFSSKYIKVYHTNQKGVSKARNFGALKSSKKSDWIIFLDADTLLKKNLLNELDNFLEKSKGKYSSGGFQIIPIEKTPKSIAMLKFYNIILQINKISFAVQAVRRDCFDFGKGERGVGYDDNLKVGEDYKILKDASKIGKFFFLKTNQVETSTRRFDQIGWTKVFTIWVLGAILPYKLKKKLDYPVIR